VFEVVVIGIDQVERGMNIVLSGADKTIIVVMIDIAWRAWNSNEILTQYGTSTTYSGIPHETPAHLADHQYIRQTDPSRLDPALGHERVTLPLTLDGPGERMGDLYRKRGRNRGRDCSHRGDGRARARTWVGGTHTCLFVLRIIDRSITIDLSVSAHLYRLVIWLPCSL
jgi:hypothetical protein